MKTIEEIIKEGESDTVEFKTTFNKEVIETLVAFANTDGGTLCLGVKDNGGLVGVDVVQESIQNWVNEIKSKTNPSVVPITQKNNIQDRLVVTFTIQSYPIKPVSFQGKYYKRIVNSNHLMTSDEIADEHLKTLNSSWDYYPDPYHVIDDLDMDKVRYFISLVEKQQQRAISLSPKEFLKRFEFTRNNKPTLGAYLLFVKEHCAISDIEVGRFKGQATIIDSLSMSTDLFTEVNEISAFIRKHLMVEYVISREPSRQERFDYPEDAIREIIINMIVHRDYRSSNASIIKIFDDCITFYNPGKLFGDLTIEVLMSGSYVSQTRNKLIAKSFKEIGYVERYGSGIMRVKQICDDYGIIAPKFEEIYEGFSVTLFKEKKEENGIKDGIRDGIRDGIKDGINHNELSDNQQLILKAIEKDPAVSAKVLAEIIGINQRNIENNLAILRDKGIVRREGSRKKGYWRILINRK